MKGKKAVEQAISFLKNNGFTTSEAQSETANGHDVVAIKNGRGFTFEVKSASFKFRCYRVSKVSKKTSDGILIVFPSGKIHVDSMENHLSKCTKSGWRFLTFVGHVYD